MKIFYAVQATGNGHISRAMELMPILTKYGKVDIFLSGSNSTLKADLPVKYRSNGLSLHYTCNGRLNHAKTIRRCAIFKAIKEAKSLPVKDYDLVLNDFEAITSIACKKQNVPMIHFGHQASFASDKTPRPHNKNILGEWILRNYASSSINLGLHFKRYDTFIQPPIIQSAIWNADPKKKSYVTVYLPSYCDKELLQLFTPIKDMQFEIFSRHCKEEMRFQHIRLLPVERSAFQQSLINCTGIITGAGFETPAEALYLGKKIMAVPIGGQYEQICNGAALSRMGIKVLDAIIKPHFKREIENWLQTNGPYPQLNWQSTEQTVDTLFDLWEKVAKSSHIIPATPAVVSYQSF
ncbi:glycosyltransferase family protein [Arachidicoccus terrestris]|uniref:glycosyltransferase family protein n=1 Tax=Arachidicoccus terrestris TaxID=2875539 RepID=UPI001CC6E94E|nr:glycosyltransferase family protein [Arachidicoccus terrestris]UAY56630.1 glycosyl transferase [Arachidicoccus terrestris]